MELRDTLPDRPPPPRERGATRVMQWIAIIVLALFLVGEIVLIAEQLIPW